VTAAPGEGRSVRDATRRLLAAIAASSNDVIIGKDLDGTVIFWNDAAERLFGFSADEMIGAPINRIIPSDRTGEETAILDRLRRGERLSHFETVRLTKDGRAIPVSVTISPIHDDDGGIVGASKIARDLSEAHRINGELQQSEALLKSILDTVPDGLIVIDRHGIIQSFSAAAERMFGFTAAEAVGRNVATLMPTSDATSHDSYIDRYLATGERRIIGIGRVVVGLRKDGSTFPMELQVGAVAMAGVQLFTGFVRDLTVREERERRLADLQAELIHVSRLSELGQMASALAHEIDQPLTAITNYARGARRLLTAEIPPALHEAIEKMSEQAARAHTIVQSLRRMVRKEQRPAQPENLRTIIEEMSALAQIGTGRSFDLDLRIGPNGENAHVERIQIQQVLLNLMRNAAQAMEHSPIQRITVTTERRGNRVEISVADSGPGLAEAVRARLFQPFVTTKSDGLGVGLSICRTIVQGHGGDLTVETEAGGGAVFRFTVEACDASSVTDIDH
jgi:two-component system, LuxR family, sensor kinase FixL